MVRYALMIYAPGESPATYSKAYETQENYDLYVGTGDMDMAAELMKQLAKEGFEMVNLSGGFDDETVQKLIEIGKDKIKVSAVRYFPEELSKLEALSSTKEYGFISFMPSVDQIEYLELFGRECNTHVLLVRDLEMACQAAAELVKMRADTIELCGWFDSLKTQAIIESIHGRVPVGSCGNG
jgi:hypothetical protein